MPLQRDYQSQEFGMRDTRQYQAAGVAQADTQPKQAVIVGDDAWRDRLLERLGTNAVKVLDKATDIAFAEEYLRGQQSAGMVESEDELQGNPLTRDWRVAGYRDTMGKIALADSEAQFQVDIKSLRTKSPEELGQYLERRRGKLVPALSGMSREARSAAVGQMLLQDRAAQKKHTIEHAKYIIEQKLQAGNTALSVALQSLGNAQTKYLLEGSDDASRAGYLSQIESTAGVLLATWADPTLPADVKQEYATQAVQNVLRNDSTDLYDYLASNKLPGTGLTLLQSLNGEQQGKLADAYREAKSRTRDKRTLAQASMVANIRSQIDNGTYAETYQQLDARLSRMVVAGDITGEARSSLLNLHSDKRFKSEKDSEIGRMWLQGRTHDLWTAGADDDKGRKAADKQMAAMGFTPEQRLNAYLEAGYNGAVSGYKAAGEVLGPALRRMRAQDGTILEQHKATVDTVFKAVQKAESEGRTWARSALLAGTSEEDRLFVERVLAKAAEGPDGHGSYELAVVGATELETQERGMAPAVRAARSAQVGTEAYKAIDSLDGRGVLETVWTWGKSMLPGSVGENAALDLELNTKDYVWQGGARGWFKDNATQKFYTDRVRSALRASVDRVLLQSPLADSGQALRAAKADLANRVIQTSFAPIPVPHGTDWRASFGVPAADRTLIGPALDRMFQSTKDGSTWRLEFSEGRLLAHEYDQAGRPITVTPRTVRPQDIAAEVKRMNEETQRVGNEAYGSGKRVGYADDTAPMGAGELVYNGQNTAGVQNTWMLSLRDNLVRNESIRTKVYEDLSGNKDKTGAVIQTVGVGISSTNTFYPKPGPDGRITPEQLKQSFTDASNAAAVTGANIARDLRDDKPTFLLMSELAYQSGPAFLTRNDKTGENYRAFAEAYKAGDAEAAKAAFKRTAAWFYSDDPKKRDPERLTPRRKHYLKLIDEALKG